jgi:hypothetical protein
MNMTFRLTEARRQVNRGALSFRPGRINAGQLGQPWLRSWSQNEFSMTRR